MSDIVDRARRWNRDGVPTAVPAHTIIRELADEIEHLRRRLKAEGLNEGPPSA